MSYHRARQALLLGLLMGLFSSCNQGPEHPAAVNPAPSAPSDATKSKVATALLPARDLKVVAGQTIYVPVYSQLRTGDRGQPFDLAVTLSIRNADRSHSI